MCENSFEPVVLFISLCAGIIIVWSGIDMYEKGSPLTQYYNKRKSKEKAALDRRCREEEITGTIHTVRSLKEMTHDHMTQADARLYKLEIIVGTIQTKLEKKK